MVVNISFMPSVTAFPDGEIFDDANDRRCRFARQVGRWTLRADCELSAALDLPPNVTLDGGGRTITLTGDAEGFESAAIRSSGGDIVNLAVDGSRLLPLAPAYFAAISVVAPGRIAHTHVRNIHFSGGSPSAIGIEVTAFDAATAVVQDIALENISGVGLLLTGDSQVTAEGVWSSDVTAAVHVSGTISATLAETFVERAEIAVLAQDQARVRIKASNVAGERVAEDRARIHQDGLTFIGARDRERARRPADAAAPAPNNRLG